MAPLTRAQAADRDRKGKESAVGILKGTAASLTISDAATNTNTVTAPKQPYQIQLSRTFLFVTFLLSLTVPFAMGTLARTFLLLPQMQQQQQPEQEQPQSQRTGGLPPPLWSQSEQQPPSTRYTSKHFSTRGTGSESFVARIPSAAADSESSSSTIRTSSSTSRLQSISYDLSILNPSEFQTEHQVVDFLNAHILTQLPRMEILSFHCHTLRARRMISCSGMAPHGHHVHAHVNTERNTLSLDIMMMGDDNGFVEGVLLGNLQATSIVPRGGGLFSKDHGVDNSNRHIKPGAADLQENHDGASECSSSQYDMVSENNDSNEDTVLLPRNTAGPLLPEANASTDSCTETDNKRNTLATRSIS